MQKRQRAHGPDVMSLAPTAKNRERGGGRRIDRENATRLVAGGIGQRSRFFS
jgi:hypothetical protein